MTLTNALLLLVVVIGLVALGVLLAYLWSRDPFKTALGSCLSSLVVLVGGLGVPSLQGTTDIMVDVGFATFRASRVSVTSATPPLLWGIAFVSIVLLVALFATLIFLRERGRLAPARPGGRADGSLGGPVF